MRLSDRTSHISQVCLASCQPGVSPKRVSFSLLETEVLAASVGALMQASTKQVVDQNGERRCPSNVAAAAVCLLESLDPRPALKRGMPTKLTR